MDPTHTHTHPVGLADWWHGSGLPWTYELYYPADTGTCKPSTAHVRVQIPAKRRRTDSLLHSNPDGLHGRRVEITE